MKTLKIENGQGYFLTEERSYKTVDKMDKTILLQLVNSALEDSFDIDVYNEEDLKNQAHQIIYKSVSEKLKDLHQKRKQFLDETERLYSAEYDKYSS